MYDLFWKDDDKGTQIDLLIQRKDNVVKCAIVWYDYKNVLFLNDI